MAQPRIKEDIFVNFITPEGRLLYSSLAEAQQELDDNQKPKFDPDTGLPIMNFSALVMWPKAMYEADLIPLRQLAATAKYKKWPNSDSDNWFRLQPFLLDGDNPEHNTKNKEELRGHVYKNFKCKAKVKKNTDGTITVLEYPETIDRYKTNISPLDVYSGCFVRISGSMFGTSYMGKNFISVRLGNVQKLRDGEKLFSRPSAKDQFDDLPPEHDIPAMFKFPNLVV